MVETTGREGGIIRYQGVEVAREVENFSLLSCRDSMDNSLITMALKKVIQI